MTWCKTKPRLQRVSDSINTHLALQLLLAFSLGMQCEVWNQAFTIHSVHQWLSACPRSISQQQGQSYFQRRDSTTAVVWHILSNPPPCRKFPPPALYMVKEKLSIWNQYLRTWLDINAAPRCCEVVRNLTKVKHRVTISLTLQLENPRSVQTIIFHRNINMTNDNP